MSGTTLARETEKQWWRSERVLRYLYWEQELSTEKVGRVLGCHRNTVCDWMDRYGIERRTQADANTLFTSTYPVTVAELNKLDPDLSHTSPKRGDNEKAAPRFDGYASGDSCPWPDCGGTLKARKGGVRAVDIGCETCARKPRNAPDSDDDTPLWGVP